MAKRNVKGYMKKVVAATAKWRCAMCNTLVDHRYHIDHILPLHRGGSNRKANLQCLCLDCHTNKTWTENTEDNASETEDTAPPKACVSSDEGSPSAIAPPSSTIILTFSGTVRNLSVQLT